jgi:4-hydroxyacetophenone monooxygenase
VSAVGQLNRPKIPEIKVASASGCAGALGCWDPSIDLTASASPSSDPAPARSSSCRRGAQVAQMYVFQRSAPWMLPNPIYHERVHAGVQLARPARAVLRPLVPFLIFYPGTDGSLPGIRIDKSWPHQAPLGQRDQRPDARAPDRRT